MSLSRKFNALTPPFDLKGAEAGDIDFAVAESNTGSYTGNSTANRAIPHGLTNTPSIIIISQTSGGTQATSNFIIFNTGRIDNHFTGGAGNGTVTAPDGTNFYVGIALNPEAGANLNNATYIWVAIGLRG